MNWSKESDKILSMLSKLWQKHPPVDRKSCLEWMMILKKLSRNVEILRQEARRVLNEPNRT